MSKSLNSVSLTGYLGADPKTHAFDNGDQVANLRLAVARQKKEDGAWVDDTIWIDVKAFGRQVEAIEQYLTKGSFIAVTGQLAQPREWEDNSGNTRFTMVVDHASVTFGPRADGGGSPPPERQKAAAAASAQGGLSDDDDIPF
jgi:single-strand DNA-binding protein